MGTYLPAIGTSKARCKTATCKPAHADGTCSPCLEDGVEALKRSIRTHCVWSLHRRGTISSTSRAASEVFSRRSWTALRGYLSRDNLVYVESLSERAAVAAHSGDTPALLQVLKKFKELSAMRPQQARLRWQRHFAGILAGTKHTWSDFAAEASHWTYHLPLSSWICSIIVKLKPGKAHDEDLVPADVLRLSPMGFAHVLLHLCQSKPLARCRNRSCGEEACAYSSGKRERAGCNAHRGIVLSDAMGKVYHRAKKYDRG